MNSKRSVWLHQELFNDLKMKKEFYIKGQIVKEEYKRMAWACRDKSRKAKTQNELYVARDIKAIRRDSLNTLGTRER